MWLLAHLPEQHCALMKQPEFTPLQPPPPPPHPPPVQAHTHWLPWTCGDQGEGQLLPTHGFLATQMHPSHVAFGIHWEDGLHDFPAHGFDTQPAKLRCVSLAIKEVPSKPSESAPLTSNTAEDTFVGSGGFVAAPALPNPIHLGTGGAQPETSSPLSAEVLAAVRRTAAEA